MKPEECRCCMEIQACRDTMLRFETEENSKCIKKHSGFNEIVFLNLYHTAQLPGFKYFHTIE